MNLQLHNSRNTIALLTGLACLCSAFARAQSNTPPAPRAIVNRAPPVGLKPSTPLPGYRLAVGQPFNTRRTLGLPVRRPAPTTPLTPARPSTKPVTNTPPQRPANQPVGQVYIRGIPYQDHSANTRLSTATIQGGQSFRIESTTLPLDGQIRVTMQDVNRGNGFGVTAFQLTNVRRSGNTLIVQAPNLPLLKNRTYHIAVFVYGATNRTANAGRLTIR